MAAKDVQFGNEVRQKMVNGVNILANAVRVTLANAATWWLTALSAARTLPKTA